VEEQKINGRLVNNFKFWNHLESKKGGGGEKKKKKRKETCKPTNRQTNNKNSRIVSVEC